MAPRCGRERQSIYIRGTCLLVVAARPPLHLQQRVLLYSLLQVQGAEPVITWMHYAPGEKPRCSNVIPDLHQPRPLLTYRVYATACGHQYRFLEIVEVARSIDQLVDDIIAHRDYGNTFVRQDPC